MNAITRIARRPRKTYQRDCREHRQRNHLHFKKAALRRGTRTLRQWMCPRDFQRDADLPDHLRYVFSAGQYKAWICFSNGNPRQGPRGFSTRGMAIKLMGVPGEKLLDDETYAGFYPDQPFEIFVDDLRLQGDPVDFLKEATSINIYGRCSSSVSLTNSGWPSANLNSRSIRYSSNTGR